MANIANIQVNEQPHNGELLWLQGQRRHRSAAIFTGDISGAQLKGRRCDKVLWDHIRDLENGRIPDNVFRHIRRAGFAGVFLTGSHKLDHALITALVERWRPETHTFHFPIGEATVTLQDVQVLWGLPIDGPVVSGEWVNQNKEIWCYYCYRMLGIQVDEDEVAGGKIKIVTLIEYLNNTEITQNQRGHKQRARLYILILLGGFLFADSSSYEVPLNFLLNLEDLTVDGRRSWGSAVLACLYRNLCTAAENPRQKGIQGPLLLVQIWAYERMPVIAPILRTNYEFREPYAARYSCYDFNYCYKLYMFIY